MSERSVLISKLKDGSNTRIAYIRAKVNVNISAQLMTLRKKLVGTQAALAEMTGMKQSRISAMEQPGATNFNIETLIRLASAFKVGLLVKFVPYSEVLRWDNSFAQDTFEVVTLDNDIEFLRPSHKEAKDGT